MKARYVVRGVVACVLGIACVGGGALACSSDKFNPSPGTEGGAGTGGGGGDAGDAGDAGSDAPKACTKSSDCDDGLACNGAETCENDVCVAGVAFCASPSDANCVATCTESAGGPQCGVAARDADGDGHGTTLCAAMPGDDCDDNDDTVHPGATETCDGVDSNCDGKLDIEEFPLSGAAKTWHTSNTDVWVGAVAWSPTAKHFGVVWEDERHGDVEVYFAAVDPAGTKVGSEVRISNAAGDSRRPRIAWGHGSFAIVWDDARDSKTEIYLRRVDAFGQPLTPELSIVPGTFLVDSHVHATTTGWVVTWRSDSQAFAQGIASNGVETLGTAVFIDGGVGAAPRVSGSGDSVSLAWSTGPTANKYDRIRIALTNAAVANPAQSTLIQPTSLEFESPVAHTALDGGSATLFHAVAPAPRVGYVAASATGIVTCKVEFGDAWATLTGATSLVNVGNGSVGAELAVDAGGPAFLLHRFDADCNAASVTLPTTDLWSGGYLAVGDEQLMAVWSESTGNTHTIKSRVFGKNLCD